MTKKKSFHAKLMILICALFLFVMLIIPLFVVIINSLKDGFTVYINSVTDKYAVSSLLITLLATIIAVIINTIFGIFAAWAITKFDFKGKSFLATIFVTFPFVSREIIPTLNAEGRS